MYLETIFVPGVNEVGLMEFIALFISARNFRKKTQNNSRFMNFIEFKEMIESKFTPGRLHDYIEHSYIPTKDEVAAASKKIETILTNESFFGNYNNLIFLQTDKKKKKKKKHRKS